MSKNELREILLSFQTGFNLVNAAVVCAILESISGLEPSLVITEPQRCMPNPVEGLLEVYSDIVAVLLVLEIFLTEDS